MGHVFWVRLKKSTDRWVWVKLKLFIILGTKVFHYYFFPSTLSINTFLLSVIFLDNTVLATVSKLTDSSRGFSQNFYEIFAKLLRNFYEIFVKFLQKFCKKFAKNHVKWFFAKYLWNIYEIFVKFLRNLQKSCKNFVKILRKTMWRVCYIVYTHSQFLLTLSLSGAVLAF